ncbi:hypothetical protein [Listeria seeligeri]|uniref:hypothetical protein n=1 Tax=Listeria seeligeri TaxID=1640 RepID=UPI0022EBCCB0|nr:hypothetical protein [Listeria seeligeri]
MRKYHIKRIGITILLTFYFFMLTPIMQGEKPFSTSADYFALILAIIVGVFASLFIFDGRIKKEYEQDKVEKDERYLKNRAIFNFYFIVALGLVIPVVFAFMSISNMEQLSLIFLAKSFIFVSLAYTILLEIVKKKA